MAKVTDSRLADWLDQVAEGLDAGLEPNSAVSLAKPLPRPLADSLTQQLELGATWQTSFEKARLPFSFSEMAILDAAEKSGSLPASLRKVANDRRELKKIKRRIRLSLAYPFLLLHFAAFVFSLMYLVDGDVRGALVSLGKLLLPVWFLCSLIWMAVSYWPRGVKIVLSKIPLLSAYRSSWDAGVLCDVLAGCLTAGIPVDRSWEIALVAADSPKLHRVGDAVLLKIKAGGKASEGLRQESERLPAGFMQVYASGEETGALDQNLAAAGSRYFSEAKSKLLLATLLYPKLLLLAVFGYAGYKIISFFSDYYQQLQDINI